MDLIFALIKVEEEFRAEGKSSAAELVKDARCALNTLRNVDLERVNAIVAGE